MRREVFMGKRQRRRFSEAFKQEAVRVCLRHDRRIGQVARELDLTESALRRWVTQSPIDHNPTSTELRTLRRDVRVLREEREILKKAAVNSRDRCNAMNDHVKEGSWNAFVAHACRQQRRRNSGDGGSEASRSVTSAVPWVVSLERSTMWWPRVAVCRRGLGRDHRGP